MLVCQGSGGLMLAHMRTHEDRNKIWMTQRLQLVSSWPPLELKSPFGITADDHMVWIALKVAAGFQLAAPGTRVPVGVTSGTSSRCG